MKRSLLGTLWIGAVAAALAIALQTSGLLARPASILAQGLGLPPNDPVGFGNFLLVLALSFGVAWTILQVMETARRARLVVLLFVELIGAAWVLHAAGVSFPPLPAILATIFATALALGVTATHSDRQRQATARLFEGRVAQSVVDRLTENKALNLSEPTAREASFVFCEIANEAELIDDLPPAVSAQLTREFIACASRRFLREGGYLHGADGEGVRVLFGFPEASERHSADAARAALAFRESFRAAASAKPESLGKIDLRIGISSGVIVASVQDDAPGGGIVLVGEPLELARRLARVNQIYGSQILLDPGTLSAGAREIVARPLDFLRCTQAHERLEVYELLALAEKTSPEAMARRDRFWTGVVYFRERRWNEAFSEFNRARSENGEQDEPLQWYLRRLEPLCRQMATEPVPVVEPLAPL
jgi:class 3 adenylate cyclase